MFNVRVSNWFGLVVLLVLSCMDFLASCIFFLIDVSIQKYWDLFEYTGRLKILVLHGHLQHCPTRVVYNPLVRTGPESPASSVKRAYACPLDVFIHANVQLGKHFFIMGEPWRCMEPD